MARHPIRAGILVATTVGILMSTGALAAAAASPTGPAVTVQPSQTYRCQGVVATIVGTNGPDDDLRGTNGNDVIVGRGGDDEIFGRGGRDLICGGHGNDKVHGQLGHDRIYGQGGADELYGHGGRDRIYGQEGNDKMFGHKSDDILNGGYGKRDEGQGGIGVDACPNTEIRSSC
jgi:Ca2+-binding RTX toxin-like protein